MIFEALKLLSERDLAALLQPAFESADANQTLNHKTVFVEIEHQIATQTKEQAPKPVRPITTNALYHWVANCLDYLALGNSSYARELLAPLCDRLKALDQHESEEHETNLDDETRELFAKGDEILAREMSEEEWAQTETVQCEPWPNDERPIYPITHPPTLVDLNPALLERLDRIAETDQHTRDVIISRILWGYINDRDVAEHEQNNHH